MWTLGIRRPPLKLTITNLYDIYCARGGSLAEEDVRSIGIAGAAVDLRVLSLELPAGVVETLGLTAAREGSNRLTPVRLTIKGRTCTVEPFRSTGERVVVGHIALT